MRADSGKISRLKQKGLYVWLKIRALIDEQTVEWTDMLERQMTEQYSLSREHLQQQLQMFTTLMQSMQEQQRKDLELKQERLTLYYCCHFWVDQSLLIVYVVYVVGLTTVLLVIKKTLYKDHALFLCSRAFFSRQAQPLEHESFIINKYLKYMFVINIILNPVKTFQVTKEAT